MASVSRMKKKRTEEKGKSEIRARKTGSEVEEDVEKREERREHRAVE